MELALGSPSSSNPHQRSPISWEIPSFVLSLHPHICSFFSLEDFYHSAISYHLEESWLNHVFMRPFLLLY